MKIILNLKSQWLKKSVVATIPASVALSVTTGVPTGVFSGKKNENVDFMKMGALSLASFTTIRTVADVAFCGLPFKSKKSYVKTEINKR